MLRRNEYFCQKSFYAHKHTRVKMPVGIKFNLTFRAITLALPYKNKKADERSRK